MFTACMFRVWALRHEQLARERERERRESQQRLEDLTIQRLVAPGPFDCSHTPS